MGEYSYNTVNTDVITYPYPESDASPKWIKNFYNWAISFESGGIYGQESVAEILA